MNKEKSVTTLSVENFHDTYRVKITVNKVVNEDHFEKGTKEWSGQFFSHIHAFSARVMEKIRDGDSIWHIFFDDNMLGCPTIEGLRKYY